MVGSVLTYSGLSALHKKLSQKLVNLASTNAGQVHKKVENYYVQRAGPMEEEKELRYPPFMSSGNY